jgi:DNA-binding CsgD family transcriptional regulator
LFITPLFWGLPVQELNRKFIPIKKPKKPISMVEEAVLTRAAGKVTAYVEKYVTLMGVDKREQVLELFDNMHRVFPHWVIGTCPVMHPDLHYASKNCNRVFGYSHEHVVKNSRVDKYFTFIHPDDQQDLYECFKFLHDFLEEVPPGEHAEYRAVFHYRYKKADGQFIYLHDEKAALKLQDPGNLYYGLFRDITSEKTFAGVKIELFHLDKHQHPVKLKEFKPAAHRTRLSKREEQLITLIKQGLSTKEIAWYLKISHNTVRNIKSKLFEKYNVSNSIELLNMAS